MNYDYAKTQKYIKWVNKTPTQHKQQMSNAKLEDARSKMLRHAAELRAQN